MNQQFVDPRFNYLDMYNWTNDLPRGEGSRQIFIDVIEYFNTKKIKEPQILEIGTYVGTSLIKIMELIPNSQGTAIDKWSDYIEHCQGEQIQILNNITQNCAENVFRNNIDKAGLSKRITAIKGSSGDILVDLLKSGKRYDFIYVDGSHTLLDSYVDIILSWKLLNTNGILVIDDVPYNRGKILDSPYEGVLKFINDYRSNMNIINLSYRVFLEKNE
jgi:predicted O-methyltransferase YrrM